MAASARNVKTLPGFDPPDKMQSNTLKRQPSPDWSKTDLLRLLSYFEGELQARDITIAALKAEKAKQLLYQAKYGRFGLGDPFMALQRDSIGTRDTNFDEAAVRSMYDNQLAQLENLIATQRKAQLKMREQLSSAEKRYHKVCSELEDEKRKHAQDTAQGDDVTYMLEKERERLKQEIDFEKSNSKKLEKDLRRTLAALEEERASAARHKQVALLLLKERKHMLQKISAERQRRGQVETILTDEQLRADDMAEGLEVESQRSVAMEAALERQLGEFESERTSLRSGLEQEQLRTRELEAQVEALQKQVQMLAVRQGIDSIEIKSSVSPQVHASAVSSSSVNQFCLSTPAHATNNYSAISSQGPIRSAVGLGGVTGSVSPNLARPSPVAGTSSSALPTWQVQRVNRVLDGGGRIGSSSPDREMFHRSTDLTTPRKVQYVSPSGGGGYSSPSQERPGGMVLSSSPRGETRVVTIGSSGPESAPLLVGASTGGARVNIAPGNSASVVTQGGGRISFHVSPGPGVSTGSGGVSSGMGSPRRTSTVTATATATSGIGRGVPPPIPPNKPNIIPVTPGGISKPATPPKVNVMMRDRGGIADSTGGVINKTVQIPVNVMVSASASSSPTPSSSSTSAQSSRESSPIRKTAQPPHFVEPDLDVVSHNKLQSETDPEASLEFLGPEMADLQELLASLSAGEAGACNSSSLVLSPSSSSSFSSPTPILSNTSSSSFSSSPSDINNSAIHKMAAAGDLNGLRMLILDRDANINLPMKDGTTPVHCAVENNKDACLRLLLENGADASALRDDHVAPLHIAVAKGFLQCAQLLLEYGADVNALAHNGDTSLNTVTQLGNKPLNTALQLRDTALHLAVQNGDVPCCQLLLQHGANVCLQGEGGLTPVHSAVINNHPDILQILLNHFATDHSSTSALLHCDGQGRSLVQIAAGLSDENCLRLLLDKIPLDLDACDTQGRSMFSAASKACKALLNQIVVQHGSRNLSLLVELKVHLEGCTVSSTRIGSVEISPYQTWESLEDRLQAIVSEFLGQLDRGLRTRRLARMETESGGDDGTNFTLGITMRHIKRFEMGLFHWGPGSRVSSDKIPHEIACNCTEKTLAVVFDGTNDLCELIAFDILHPISVLHDYLRLLSQYKSVVFHGPVNSGKSYLTQRLAQCLASEEKAQGRSPVIHKLPLTNRTTHEDLVTFLKQKGCLLRVDQHTPVSPILIMEDLENINMSNLFGPLLDPVAYRGTQHSFALSVDSEDFCQRYYFPETLYILATLNRTRSIGTDLHVQQRFRWVHFRHDTEPIRNLLARHFFRRLCHLGDGSLPAPDDPLLRTVEWIICIWQRVNDSLGKLGLSEVAVGPCGFFKCPIEKRNPELILQWVQELWNGTIAPQVREAVRKGTGSDAPAQGQQKVANTALYVLMQRAVVFGCPISGSEKEVYLKGFIGSNELDLPFKVAKSDHNTANTGIISPPNRWSKPVQRESVDKKVALSSTWSSLTPGYEAKNMTTSTSPTTPGKTGNKHRGERARPLEFFTGSNIKRRSLSESSVNNTLEQHDEFILSENNHRQCQQQGIGNQNESGPIFSEQAKVAKLEVRSPRILSLSNSFKPSHSNNMDSRGNGAEKAVINNSLSSVSGRSGSSNHHHQNKKSRSSENISPSGLYLGGKLTNQPNSPFSFSLSTPKSSLTSFKFFNNSIQSDQLSAPTSISTFTSSLPSSSSFQSPPSPQGTSSSASQDLDIREMSATFRMTDMTQTHSISQSKSERFLVHTESGQL